MGKKSKNKKGAKVADKHPRRCRCDDCNAARNSRKWNKRRTIIEKEYADYNRKEREERRSGQTVHSGFLAGGHHSLKRDYYFEGSDRYMEPLSPLHGQVRANIRSTFSGNFSSDPSVYNPGFKLWRVYQMDFDQEVFKKFGGNTLFLWHGTRNIDNVSSIVNRGFEVRGPHCLLGAGIYLAPHWSKAWNYTSGIYWYGARSGGNYRTMLLCAARLGKILPSEYSVKHRPGCPNKGGFYKMMGGCLKECNTYRKPNANIVRELGYDSCSARAGRHPGAWAGYLNGAEYCAYDSERVLPLFACIFKIGD